MQGERSLPRLIERGYVLLALDGFNAQKEPLAGGMQRGRAAGPLAKMVLYYNTHLAYGAIGLIFATFEPLVFSSA